LKRARYGELPYQSPRILLAVIPGLRKAQNPESSCKCVLKTGLLAPSLALALRAIGFADVRFGFPPPQSGSRLRRVRNDGSGVITTSRPRNKA